MRLRLLRARYVVLLVLVTAITVCTVFLFSPSDGLVIVASNTNFEISAKCTFGTNHVYFYGGELGSFLDPILKRWTDTNAYRLRYTSDQTSTVIWVRLLQRDNTKPSPVATTKGSVRMPEGGYSRLRARLISKAGKEAVLAPNGRLQHYRPTRTGGCYVEGWLLQGSLEDYRGSVFQVDSPDGIAIATLHVR